MGNNLMNEKMYCKDNREDDGWISMHQCVLECKCALCEESLRQPWRRTFSWPRGSSGKLFGGSGKKIRAWPGRCSS